VTRSISSSIIDLMYDSWNTPNPVSNTFLLNSSIEDLLQSKTVYFSSNRSTLLHVSKLIESECLKNNLPLLIDIQNEKRFGPSKNRLFKLFQSLPKVILIGDLNEAKLPQNVSLINCKNNPLEHNWMVLSKNKRGFFGIVCDETSDGEFRGFFSADPTIMSFVLTKIKFLASDSFDL